MKRMIALLLLLCMLTACAAPVPETEEPTAASQEIAVPEQKQPDSGTMTGAATFTQAASEPLTYTVVLKTLEDSAAAADGTTLAVRSYELPEMTGRHCADGGGLPGGDGGPGEGGGFQQPVPRLGRGGWL